METKTTLRTRYVGDKKDVHITKETLYLTAQEVQCMFPFTVGVHVSMLAIKTRFCECNLIRCEPSSSRTSRKKGPQFLNKNQKETSRFLDQRFID